MLLTRKEAAARLGISVPTLDAERAAGRIGYIQRAENCRVFFRESDLDTYLARYSHQPIPQQRSGSAKYRTTRWKVRG